MSKSLSFLKEQIDRSEVKIIKEDVAGETQKKLYITGPFLQGNIKNRNGRIYPTPMLGECIDKFVKTKMRGIGAASELGHPLSVEINLDRVSHYVTELKLEGNNGMGKAMIASTPKGQIARALIEDGMILGVSTRGLGKLTETASGDKLVSDYDLVAIDIVESPSAPDAYTEAIMEGLQYFIDNNGNVRLNSSIDQIVETFKQNISKLPTKSEANRVTKYAAINKVLDALNKIS